MIEVKVAGVLFDNQTNSPVMLLKELDGNKILPIFIGPVEATAIIYALDNINLSRPLTIDLLKLVIDGLKAKVTRVLINNLKNDTFFAEIIIENNGKILAVDARPSDSVGLAVRTKIPIYVADEVMNTAGIIMTEQDEARLSELRDSIRNIPPEELGNYKM
ncbi:MAG: bifunctional nuclease family protein [Candidatus Latescibacteria bacterium]|nr:bifunctional nuclease family protein [Candidatus Latescibacterota bacterium]